MVSYEGAHPDHDQFRHSVLPVPIPWRCELPSSHAAIKQTVPA